MSATVAVPRSVVSWARRHYRRTGRPYLLGGLAGDVRFDVSPGSRGRYLLTLAVEDADRLGLFATCEGSTLEERTAGAFLGLADFAVTALGGEEIVFECDGQRLGRVEIVTSPFGTRAVRVRGHVSLTCLSWLLHEGRAGYYLALPAVLGEVASATGRQLHGRSTREARDG